MSLNLREIPDKFKFPASRLERSLGQQQPSQAWTTARCHRLLRPLVSRIAILRKDAAAASSAPSLPVAQPAPSHEGARKARAEESEWWLMPRKKRARLTYSQRRTSPRQSVDGEGGGGDSSASRGAGRTVPRGEIVPPTPLLQRARGHIPSSPVSTPAAAVPANTNPRGRGLAYINSDNNNNTRTTTSRCEPYGGRSFRNLDERLAKLRTQVPPERHGDLEAVYRSLDLLLKATAHGNDPGRARAKGPRSFLAMCLRKVPQYIAELEAWERWDAEQSGTVSTLDSIDTSAQIYNELESLGAHQGWKHLRVVVRADGLRAVREGMSEGLFSDEFSQLLIDLCVQRGALSEAQELVAAFVDRQYPFPISTDSTFRQLPALQPLISLTCYAGMVGRASFLFRQYSTLLSSNKLPQDWLATLEFERIWGQATRALCSTKANEAVAFMIEAISLMCSRKRTFTGTTETIQLEKDMSEASQRTLTSTLTILAAMSLIGENEPKPLSAQEAELQKAQLIGHRLQYVLKTCIAGLEPHTRRRNNTRVDMLHLALLLSSGRSQGNYVESRVRGSIMNIWRQHDVPRSTRDGRTRSRDDNLAALISSVARHCSRGASVASHKCLEDLFGRLGRLDIDGHILDSLKGAAAFSLAQQTNNVRDLIYAEKLSSHSNDSDGGAAGGAGGGSKHHPTGRTFFTGYRWDETIGEWVTVSPVANKRQQGGRARLLRSSSASSSTANVVDRPASNAGVTLRPTRSRSLIRRDTDSIADPETDQGGDVGSSSVGNEHQTPRRQMGPVGRRRGGSITPTRKRPRRASSSHSSLDEDDGSLASPLLSNVTTLPTITTTAPAAESTSVPRFGRVLSTRKSIHHRRRHHHHHHHDDELGGHEDDDDDENNKENRARMPARKPRRSSGRVVAGSRRTLSNRRRTTEDGAKAGGLERRVYSSDDELCI